jgi:hypothetical protein
VLRVLFQNRHTLHAKVSIPLAVWLADRGHDVSFVRQGHGFNRFSARYVRRHPTSVRIVDRRSLAFVARLSGYGGDWERVTGSITFTSRPRYHEYDAIIGTTKELPELRAVRARYGVRVFALGYQHMPFVVSVGEPFRRATGRRPSPLLEENPFTERHAFAEILEDCDAEPNGFTYLDRVPAGHDDRPGMGLVFHPGGYRGVVSDPGDSRSLCHRKQVGLLERACLPLLEVGLFPVVKVHPLRARFHDEPDVKAVAEEVERRHGLASESIGVLGPESSAWPVAQRSAVILNYGSSSLYELWSAGIRTAIVCNFEGRSRSEKFDLFPAIFFDRHTRYVDWLRAGDFRRLELDPLAERVFTAYRSLHDGHATERAAHLVLDELSS